MSKAVRRGSTERAESAAGLWGKGCPLKHKQDKRLEQFEQNPERDFLQRSVVTGCPGFSGNSYFFPS